MRTRPLFAMLISAALMAGAATGCEKKSSTGGTGSDTKGSQPVAAGKADTAASASRSWLARLFP